MQPGRPTAAGARTLGAAWRVHTALLRWEATRTQPPLRFVGLDEKYLGRRGKWKDRFVTIVSDLETGEPRWFDFGRGEATVKRWLETLSDPEKSRIVLAAMDMHDPFRAAIKGDEKLAHVAIVHDPFHVMKRANEAVDELRRQVFFRLFVEDRGESGTAAVPSYGQPLRACPQDLDNRCAVAHTAHRLYCYYWIEVSEGRAKLPSDARLGSNHRTTE